MGTQRKITITRRERMAKVLELRKGGANFAQIADKLSISKTQAYKDFRDALKDLTQEPALDVLKIELERLDAMLLGLWRDARTGDVKAIGSVLKIMDRRAKYLGLDEVPAPDGSAEAREALDDLHAAIINAANVLAPEDDGEVEP
jgi:putative sterol carrier protein